VLVIASPNGGDLPCTCWVQSAWCSSVASEGCLNDSAEQLQDGQFVPLEQTAMVKSGEKKPDLLHIKRQMPSGKTLRFEIRDRVPSDGSKNWERVVAVVCSGKLWQFKKGYPFPVRHVPSTALVLGLCRLLVSNLLSPGKIRVLLEVL
jgi:hypothetical protein